MANGKDLKGNIIVDDKGRVVPWDDDKAVAAVFRAILDINGDMTDAQIAKAARSVKGSAHDAAVADDRLSAVEKAAARVMDRKTEVRSVMVGSIGYQIAAKLGEDYDRLQTEADHAGDTLKGTPILLAAQFLKKFKPEERKAWPKMGTKLPKEGEPLPNYPVEQYKTSDGKTSTVAADVYDATTYGKRNAAMREAIDVVKGDGDVDLTELVKALRSYLDDPSISVANLGDKHRRNAIRQQVSNYRTDGISRTRTAMKFLQYIDALKELNIRVAYVGGKIDECGKRRKPITLIEDVIVVDEEGNKTVEPRESEAMAITRLNRFKIDEAIKLVAEDKTGEMTALLALRKTLQKAPNLNKTGKGGAEGVAISVKNAPQCDGAVAALSGYLEGEAGKAAYMALLAGDGMEGSVASLAALRDNLAELMEPFDKARREQNAANILARAQKAAAQAKAS